MKRAEGNRNEECGGERCFVGVGREGRESHRQHTAAQRAAVRLGLWAAGEVPVVLAGIVQANHMPGCRSAQSRLSLLLHLARSDANRSWPCSLRTHSPYAALEIFAASCCVCVRDRVQLTHCLRKSIQRKNCLHGSGPSCLLDPFQDVPNMASVSECRLSAQPLHAFLSFSLSSARFEHFPVSPPN